MIQFAGALILAFGLAAPATPLFAQTETATVTVVDRDFAKLQERDARLFAAGWKLTSANARFCKDTVPSIGVLLHDAATYGDPDKLRAMLGLSGDIAVQAVAPGSPAENAGISRNATLASVNEVLISEYFERTQPSWQRLVSVNEAIETEFALTAPALVAWINADGSVGADEIASVPVCSTRFEVHPKSDRAVAEGTRVILGADFAGFAYPEDEFAAAVAHELAHNLLGHRRLLDAEGRGRKLIRLTERDADRLMPWLLYNAGYDPQAAVRFMARWGPRHGGGLLRKRTHDGWDERVEFIEAEIARIASLASAETSADWSVHFVEEAR